MKIFSAGPNINKSDQKIVSHAALNAWYDQMSFYHDKSLNIIKKKFNSKNVILFSSCTGAMEVLFKSLNYKKGSEILVPETTWIGTVSGLIHLGLKPIFVDVKMEDWNIDPKKLKAKLTKKTKAIISVDCYGNPSDKNSLMKFSKNFGLDLIEDAAPGIGSKYKKNFCGTFGKAGVFSFQGAKPLTCGEGGAIITNDNNLADKINYYSDHCRDNSKVLYSTDIGFKFKLSNIQAALLFSQFKRFDEIINKRRNIFLTYKKNLKYQEYFNMNNTDKNIYNNFYVPSIVFNKSFKIKKLMNHLNSKKIPHRPFFRPLSSLPMFKKQNNPVAYYLFQNGINLPSFSQMKKFHIEYVSKQINFFLKKDFT